MMMMMMQQSAVCIAGSDVWQPARRCIAMWCVSAAYITMQRVRCASSVYSYRSPCSDRISCSSVDVINRCYRYIYSQAILSLPSSLLLYSTSDPQSDCGKCDTLVYLSSMGDKNRSMQGHNFGLKVGYQFRTEEHGALGYRARRDETWRGPGRISPGRKRF